MVEHVATAQTRNKYQVRHTHIRSSRFAGDTEFCKIKISAEFCKIKISVYWIANE